MGWMSDAFCPGGLMGLTGVLLNWNDAGANLPAWLDLLTPTRVNYTKNIGAYKTIRCISLPVHCSFGLPVRFFLLHTLSAAFRAG